jgi:hypothetical protein
MSIKTERFYRTKPCSAILNNKICINTNCSYAHSLSELRDIECMYSTNCNKHNCTFKHAYETSEQYRKRIDFIEPAFQNLSLDSDSDEDIEVITDNKDVTPYEEPKIYYKNTLKTIELEKNHEMSLVWGIMAVCSHRDVKWV